MTNQNAPDERVVYLALKNVFRGPNAELRQPKKIRRLINESAAQGNIEHLVASHNIDHICNAARVLLTEEVFQSTLKAKIRFPEIFDVSPAQSAERAASVAEAVRTDARALKDAAVSSPEALTRSLSIDTVETLRPERALATESGQTAPSLFPAYLPLGAQHRLLSKLQTILESSCFRFAQSNLPAVLKNYSWDCPEAAELHIWAKEFLMRRDKFGEAENSLGKPVQDVLRSTADIRHAAVHRLRLSARGLEQFIINAECLATLIQDEDCLVSLSTLRRETVAVIEELERNKHVLNSNFEDAKRKIAAKRAELDEFEKMAALEMQNDDREYQAIAGNSLDHVMATFDCRKLQGTGRKGESDMRRDVADDYEDYASDSCGC